MVASMGSRGGLGSNRFNLVVLDSVSSPPDTRTTGLAAEFAVGAVPEVGTTRGGEKTKICLMTARSMQPLKLLTVEGEGGSNKQA